MSDYTVIKSVGTTLQELLWAEFQAIPNTAIDARSKIKFDPPFRLLDEDHTPSKGDCLSIYLYRIVENGDLRNRLPQARALDSEHLLQYPPLCLNLYYLVTPITDDAFENDSLILGKVQQTFHDHAILKGEDLQGELANTTEELRLSHDPISIEDLMRLWGGFMCPYRLSVSYEVKVVYIDSERERTITPVRRRQLAFTPTHGGSAP